MCWVSYLWISIPNRTKIAFQELSLAGWAFPGWARWQNWLRKWCLVIPQALNASLLTESCKVQSILTLYLTKRNYLFISNAFCNILCRIPRSRCMLISKMLQALSELGKNASCFANPIWLFNSPVIQLFFVCITQCKVYRRILLIAYFPEVLCSAFPTLPAFYTQFLLRTKVKSG